MDKAIKSIEKGIENWHAAKEKEAAFIVPVQALPSLLEQIGNGRCGQSRMTFQRFVAPTEQSMSKPNNS